MLILPKQVFLDMAKWLCQAYPNEGGGLLFGTHRGGNKLAAMVRPCVNAEEHPAFSFILDPQEYLEAHNEAKAKDMQVIAMFHSHPNIMSEPSITDLRCAFPGYSFVIASVHGPKYWKPETMKQKPRLRTVQSWLLKEFPSRKRPRAFIEEHLRIQGVRD